MSSHKKAILVHVCIMATHCNRNTREGKHFSQHVAPQWLLQHEGHGNAIIHFRFGYKRHISLSGSVLTPTNEMKSFTSCYHVPCLGLMCLCVISAYMYHDPDQELEMDTAARFLMGNDHQFFSYYRQMLPAIIPKDSELRNQIQRLLYPSKADKKRAKMAMLR